MIGQATPDRATGQLARNLFPAGACNRLSCLSNRGLLLPMARGATGPVHRLGLRAFLPRTREKAMGPADILQSYLDDIAQTVMKEQFDAYAARIQLPLRILTSQASLKVATTEDLKDGFESFIEMIQSHGVTDYLRFVHAANFQGNDHIVGVYETRMLSEGRLALPIFHSKIWIGQYGGAWKAIKIHNTTKETRWPMLLSRLDGPPSKEN
jgi:hypothetical protein